MPEQPARTRQEVTRRWAAADAAVEARLRARRTRRPRRTRPTTIITPSNPFGADDGPDSDSDNNDDEEGEMQQQRQFAEGYGRGPLDSTPNDHSSDSSDDDDDRDANLHIVINDGISLHYVPVGRYMFGADPELSGEESDEDDSDDEDDSALDALLRAGDLLGRRNAMEAAQGPAMRDMRQTADVEGERSRQLQSSRMMDDVNALMQRALPAIQRDLEAMMAAMARRN